MDSIQEGLREVDITLSGIDFHCSNMLQLVLANDNVYSALLEKCRDKESVISYLQNAIWKYRSSINSRPYLNTHPYFSKILPDKQVKPKLPDEFFLNLILPVVDRISQIIISKRLAK